MKRIILLLISLYLLILLQTGFFNFLKVSPNFILLAVLMIILFQRKITSFGLIAVVSGGFLLDAFSGFFFGISILTLLLIYFLSFFLLKVLIRTSALEVLILIVLGTFAYNLFIPVFQYLSDLIFTASPIFHLNISYLLIFELVLNLILGTPAFYLVKKCKF